VVHTSNPRAFNESPEALVLQEVRKSLDMISSELREFTVDFETGTARNSVP
jgi:hypothetical protein